MAMKNKRMPRRLKIFAFFAMLAVLLFAVSGCIRPDPVDGNNMDANPTLLQFATATPVPEGLTGEETDVNGTSAPEVVVPTPTATVTVAPNVTFSIGGDTTQIGPAGVITGSQTASASASATAITSLRLGDTGNRVSSLQQQLKNLGYYTGSVDGTFGEGTEKAVRAFQSRNGLSVDGIAGQSTLKLLESGTAKKAATASPTPKPTAKPTATSSALRVGSTGTKVKNMQQRLKDLGYYTGSVDGVFGQGTENAVKAFQRANGLSADGVAGTATLSKLNSSSAKSNYAASSSATSRPAMRTYTPSTLSTYRYLQLGSSGSDVTKLQQRLKDLGYFNGSVNGSFGSDTETALRAFQERNGLWVDGVAGEDTQRMLYSSDALSAKK